MPRSLLSAALLALAALPAGAQGSRGHPARPTTPAIAAADAASRLYLLADDSMMGRQAGHRGNVMATDYIAAEFRRMGLEPAGEQGFFQTIPLMRKALEPGASLTAGGRALAVGEEFVPLRYVANAFPYGPQLRAEAVPTVFGGRIGGPMITAQQARGRVVLLLPPTGADGQPNYRFWTVQRGHPYPDAAAVAVISLEVTPANLIGFLQSSSLEMEETPAAPLGAPGLLLSRGAAEAILGRPLAQATPGMAGQPVSGRFRFGSTPAADPARNVIAMLRGSDPALNQQYVVIGAHNDHEGILDRALDHDSVRAYNRVMRPQGANDPPGQPSAEQWARIRTLADSMRAAHGGGVRRDSIMNGADDDGSGTVALLEIAESLAAGPRPRRSILFVSHTAEEAGLLGSQHFTDHPTVPRDSMVAALNMDMVGRGRAEDIAGGGPRYIQLIGSRRLSTQLGAAIDSLNASREQPMQIDYSFDAAGHPLNRYCRSDHFMYARYGIPITYLSRGYHIDYHQVGDEPQYIDYEGLATVAGFVRDIAVTVANRPTRLVVDGPRQDPDAPCRQ